MVSNHTKMTLRAPKADLAAIKKLAKAEGRSLNSQIARILSEYVKAQQQQPA